MRIRNAPSARNGVSTRAPVNAPVICRPGHGFASVSTSKKLMLLSNFENSSGVIGSLIWVWSLMIAVSADQGTLAASPMVEHFFHAADRFSKVEIGRAHV